VVEIVAEVELVDVERDEEGGEGWWLAGCAEEGDSETWTVREGVSMRVKSL